MALALCRGIRERYPEWRHLLDGDGGDENLKDYPIEENPELTIRSVVNNPLLYQEGWGVGRLKHSLTYTGGQSRSCSRTYAPLRRFGFEGFSPFTRPDVIEVAEAIPFAAMAGGDPARLYAIKGDIVSRGVAAVTGLAMPVFPKRRFQHGAVGADGATRPSFPGEAAYRRTSSPCTPDAAVSSGYPAEDASARPLDPRPAASAKPARPATRLRRARRAGGLGGRRGDRRRHDLPDQPRVPLALPDVRPLEEHAGGDRAAAARSPRRSGRPWRDFRRRAASSSTTPAASSIRARSRRGPRRDRRARAAVRAGDRGGASRPWSERPA